MACVSNASPLINLARIGRLELIRRLRGEIFISPAVHLEVVKRHPEKPGAKQISESTWIHVKPPVDQAAVDDLSGFVGAGEAESIILAAEVSAEWLIIDELKGRQVARDRGLRVVGPLGILKAAYRRGWIAELKQALDQLRAAGTWISDELYKRILGT